jgi:hypothetical protein
MAIAAKDDIILQTGSEFNFIQGNVQAYEFNLYKDFIGSPLNLSEPTSIHVAVYHDGSKYLQYSNPITNAATGELELDLQNNTGKVSFVINNQQSLAVPPGEVFIQVSVIYENYYPQPKVYIFEPVKIGESIEGDGGVVDPGTDPGTGTSIFNGSTFMVEAVNGSNPTDAGKVTVDSHEPALVTSVLFRNLDEAESRITLLENFLKNRIGIDGVSGTITLTEVGDTNMYAIYKIESWERVDINPGDGDDQNSDGIKINVVLEDLSSGPGVTRSTFVVGQKLTYSLDAVGIGASNIKEGINTYLDKNINPTETSGNGAATGITITYSPYYDSYVMVEINGISVEVGNGTKDKDVYFSGNGGLTATTIEEIRSGDQLYWNGEIAGYDLSPGDQVNLIYEVDVDTLR